jgi:hypothetical protein
MYKILGFVEYKETRKDRVRRFISEGLKDGFIKVAIKNYYKGSLKEGDVGFSRRFVDSYLYILGVCRVLQENGIGKI